MALETATKPNPAFAVEVEQVQSDLAAWRKRRKPREPIPELLWYDMAQLARCKGLSPIAHAFRVNYTSLKQRVLFDSKPLQTGDPFRL
jgi:hypothetical protein